MCQGLHTGQVSLLMELADAADLQDQQRSERTVPGKGIPLLSMLTPCTASFDRHPAVLTGR